MRYLCPEGCVVDVGMSKPHPSPCPDHGPFTYEKQLKRGGPLRRVSEKRQVEDQQAGRRRPALKRTRRRETPLEREAREHFNATVKARPCLFKITRPCRPCQGTGEVDTHLEGDYAKAICAACGGDGKHHCRGEKDAHHIIKKSFIRMQFQAILPEPEFVAILFHPHIGAPLCRYDAHESVELGNDRIYWEDLSPECLELVSSLPDFVLIELERKCPKRQQQGPVAAPDRSLN